MNIKYKSYKVINNMFTYIEFVNGIEVSKMIPLYIDNKVNPMAYSIVKEIERIRNELKSDNYHPHMDFYNSIKNPLDNYETLFILVNSYACDLKNGSMYYTLTHANTGKKQFKGKIVTSSRDIFFAKLFNLWKSSVIKYSEVNPSYKELAEYLKKIEDIRTYREYLNLLRDSMINKNIFTSMCLFTDWQHISSDLVMVGNSKTLRTLDHRFYINIEGIKLYDFLNVLLNKCLELRLPFYFKFNEDCARDDSVVIFSDTSHFMKYIDLFEDIKDEYPEIITYCEKPPILTGEFLGYVGYGSEPEVSDANHKLSFNELREKIIKNAFEITIDNWIEENINKGIMINDRQISTIDLIAEVCSNQIYGYYKELFNHYKVNNQLETFRNNYGLSSIDFERPDLKITIYERIKKHAKGIISDPNYIEMHKDELSIDVQNGKVIEITESKFLSAKKGIVKYIFTDDKKLMDTLKNNINKFAKFEGVDSINFAFDERIKTKFELQDKFLRRRWALEKEDTIYQRSA